MLHIKYVVISTKERKKSEKRNINKAYVFIVGVRDMISFVGVYTVYVYV